MKFVAILFLLLASGGRAFLTPSQTARRTSLCVASDEYTEEECQEMRDLILSISLEPTDEERRTRLGDVFQEALARPNGAPKRFSDLFDMMLVKVGDEIQMEAKKKYLEKQAVEGDKDEAAETVEATADDNSPTPSNSLEFKSPEEFQLWAVVDMMVQSKTIVKKENGELGSKGTFQ